MKSRSRTRRRHRSSTDLVLRRDGSVECVPHRGPGSQLVRAAVRPVNLATLALLLVAQLLLGLHVLVTVLVYAIFVLTTLLQQRSRTFPTGSYRVREAVMHLPPTLRTRVLNVLDMVERVQDSTAELAHPPAGIAAGLDQVVATLIETAQQLDAVDRHLRTIRRDGIRANLQAVRERAETQPEQVPVVAALEEQLEVVDRLHERRSGLDLQIDQIGANLGVLHARIVQAQVEAEQVPDLGPELEALRDRTRALAQATREVRELSA